MTKACAVVLVIMVVGLMMMTVAAQTEAPLVVENELYAFSFTVEKDSVVTYREGGTGFTSIHNSTGGASGSEPDYGLVIFGRTTYGLSAEEARAVGLGEKEVLLGLDDIDSQAAMDKLITAQMAAHGRKPVGTASVTAVDGSTLNVPYFTWQRTVGTVTHHALMYVVRHDTGFILVQVESTNALSGERLAWLTGKLKLVRPADKQPAG